MDWREVTIYTTTAGIGPVEAVLEDNGIEGYVLEDAADFEEFLKDTEIYWDYVDEELVREKRAQETCLKIYLSDDEAGAKQYAALRTSLENLKARDEEHAWGRLVTETALTRLLQGRTVGTEGHKIVLPSHVVQTFGILTAAGLHLNGLGLAFLNGIGSLATGSHRGREYHFVVIGNLIGDLRPFGIEYHNLCRVGQLQATGYFVHGHLHHLARTFHIKRIADNDRHRTVVRTGHQYTGSQAG